MSKEELSTRYFLSEQQGKAVQEILNRYVNEVLVVERDGYNRDPERFLLSAEDLDQTKAQLQRDIDYIQELSSLFD